MHAARKDHRHLQRWIGVCAHKMSYIKLATAAIVSLGDRTGSTAKAIAKQIESETGKCNMPALKKALEKGVWAGELRQVKASYFVKGAAQAVAAVAPGTQPGAVAVVPPGAQPGKYGNYIALPFLVDKKDKTAAKKLGGQWFRGGDSAWGSGGNPYEGEWGVPAGVELEPFQQWMFQPKAAAGAVAGPAAGAAGGAVASEPTMLNVPFAEKNAAKKLGAKWNGENKKWYVPAGLDPAPFTQWIPSEASMAKAKKQEEKTNALCEQLAAACPSNQRILDILAELSWFELGGGNRVHQSKNKKLATEHSKLAHNIAKMTEPLNLGSSTGLLASLSPAVAEDLTDLLTEGTKWSCWPDGTTDETSDVPVVRAEGLHTVADDCYPWSDESDFTCPVGQCWRVWLYRLDHPNNYNVHMMDHYHGGHDCTGFTTNSMYKVPDTTKGYRERYTNDA